MRWAITRRDAERIAGAIFLIVFSAAIMLTYGWECHYETERSGYTFEFVEHCEPVYGIVALGLVFLLVGIAVIAYTVVRVIRSPRRYVPRERQRRSS